VAIGIRVNDSDRHSLAHLNVLVGHNASGIDDDAALSAQARQHRDSLRHRGPVRAIFSKARLFSATSTTGHSPEGLTA
jgi:hypothetical protein